MIQSVRAHLWKCIFPSFGCDISFVSEIVLEVSIGHEWQDEVGRLAVCIKDDSLHTKHIGMVKGAHSCLYYVVEQCTSFFAKKQ